MKCRLRRFRLLRLCRLRVLRDLVHLEEHKQFKDSWSPCASMKQATNLDLRVGDQELNKTVGLGNKSILLSEPYRKHTHFRKQKRSFLLYRFLLFFLHISTSRRPSRSMTRRDARRDARRDTLTLTAMYRVRCSETKRLLYIIYYRLFIWRRFCFSNI